MRHLFCLRSEIFSNCYNFVLTHDAAPVPFNLRSNYFQKEPLARRPSQSVQSVPFRAGVRQPPFPRSVGRTGCAQRAPEKSGVLCACPESIINAGVVLRSSDTWGSPESVCDVYSG